MRTRRLGLLPLLVGLLLLSIPPASAKGPRAWKAVRSWLYQLQRLEAAAVGRSSYDLVVLDRSRDGTDGGAFTPANLAAMRGSRRDRLLVAYLSIGEAEDYRGYWRPEWRDHPPPWLEKVNPDWPGNYKVRYWDAAWQAVVRRTLAQIQAQGFDGVYLDLVDAYEYFDEQGVANAASSMAAFINSLAATARATDPDFGVFMQNGERLLEHPTVLAALTGIAREEMFFGWEGADGKPTPPDETRAITQQLERARRAGRLVLTVDYTTAPRQMAEAFRRAATAGWVEYCTVRALDRMVPTQAWGGR